VDLRTIETAYDRVTELRASCAMASTMPPAAAVKNLSEILDAILAATLEHLGDMSGAINHGIDEAKDHREASFRHHIRPSNMFEG
jgi:hypothetical protein